jgi:hypothetical protein
MAEDTVTCEPFSAKIPCKQGKILRISPETLLSKPAFGEYSVEFCVSYGHTALKNPREEQGIVKGIAGNLVPC